jgi:hypothetical protein
MAEGFTARLLLLYLCLFDRTSAVIVVVLHDDQATVRWLS